MAKPAVTDTVDLNLPLEKLLREMMYIRHFEEKTIFAYRQGKALGYLHTVIGMEAVHVGWMHAIRKEYDYIITAYRDHAFPLLLDIEPWKVMAEIMGRSGGLSRGKGGSMHLYAPEKGMFGGWGIVGGHTPLGAGLAFASKYRGEDRVTLNFLGDGAANAGVFFESLNMSGLWDLPCIFIIENNEFAMGTRLERHAADTELWKRGFPFKMLHERVDGMDVEQVCKDAERIVEYCRKESKPALIEVMCYRFSGHGAADNDRQLYRTKEEEAENLKRDPIERLKNKMIQLNLLNEEKYEAIDAEILEEVEHVYAKADASPHPEPQEVYDNVYSDMSPERGH